MSAFPVPSEYAAASALLLLNRSNNVEDPMRWRRLMSSAAIRWKAEAILNLLSSAFVGGCGCLPEVEIRQKIGDSPDTSKALRELMELKMVKRLGTGGRGHPYVYTIA